MSAVTDDPRATVVDLLGAAPTVGLAEVVAVADLQEREDRKYLVDPATAIGVVKALVDRVTVLDIGGARLSRYRSTYFDTPDLASYHATAFGRRRRFKVRTRSYLDSGECVLEVKLRGGRGATVKSRRPHTVEMAGRLDGDALDFLAAHTGIDAPALSLLRPTLVTSYRRITLLDAGSSSRITLDWDLVWESTDRRTVTSEPIVVETKTSRGAGPADRVLWRLGHRPQPMSKYGVGMALLHPALPSNRWRRVIGTCCDHPADERHQAVATHASVE